MAGFYGVTSTAASLKVKLFFFPPRSAFNLTISVFCALATLNRKCERKCVKESHTERRKQVFLFSSTACRVAYCFSFVTRLYDFGPSVKVYFFVSDIALHFLCDGHEQCI